MVSARGSGEPAHIRRFETVIRVPGAATGDAFAVLEHRLAPGILAMPRHRHAATETLVVLSGALHVELDRSVRVLHAGDIAVVAPGLDHTFWVGHDAAEPTVFLAFMTPAGLERYFLDVAAAVPRDGQPSMEAVHAAGERHGVSVDLESLYDLIERHTIQLS
jgi:quercetin dioxygenase-like cupin family protein